MALTSNDIFPARMVIFSPKSCHQAASIDTTQRQLTIRSNQITATLTLYKSTVLLLAQLFLKKVVVLPFGTIKQQL